MAGKKNSSGFDIAGKLKALEKYVAAEKRKLVKPLRQSVNSLRKQLLKAERALERATGMSSAPAPRAASGRGRKPGRKAAAGGSASGRANVSPETRKAVYEATPKKGTWAHVADIAKAAKVSKITASNALAALRADGQVNGFNRKFEPAKERVATWSRA